MFMGVIAAGVVLFAAIGIGNASFAAGSMAASDRADYGVQSYNPRQVPNVQPYAQNDVQPRQPVAAPQQFDTYRQSPQVAGPGWQRGVGGFGFFGGILRLIGTVFFIGFILTLVRRVFFRGRGFPGGMGAGMRGPWGQGGPGQGNSGVPPHFHGPFHGPAAPQDPAAPQGPAAPQTQPTDTVKPQNPDAL